MCIKSIVILNTDGDLRQQKNIDVIIIFHDVVFYKMELNTRIVDDRTAANRAENDFELRRLSKVKFYVSHDIFEPIHCRYG
jgi:hypothetical protein